MAWVAAVAGLVGQLINRPEPNNQATTTQTLMALFRAQQSQGNPVASTPGTTPPPAGANTLDEARTATA
ncbi:MAG: hypothetical protein IPJ69_14955 [Deltaproteobacteria bacterium]|nr:MAG: hypothetical protein IPJ69_14955 [Deltaproteobacteria bacterium]